MVMLVVVLAVTTTVTQLNLTILLFGMESKFVHSTNPPRSVSESKKTLEGLTKRVLVL